MWKLISLINISLIVNLCTLSFVSIHFDHTKQKITILFLMIKLATWIMDLPRVVAPDLAFVDNEYAELKTVLLS
jgi:hypothetical protein